MSIPRPTARQKGLTTTASMNAKQLLCHGCKQRFPVLALDPNGVPKCATCFPRGHELIKVVEG